MSTSTKIAMALLVLGYVNVINENWLVVGEYIGDIYKDEDDTVNFPDFAELAQVW